jgi:plastocyanin
MKTRWLGVIGLVLIFGVGLLVWSCKKSTSPGGGGTAADITIGIIGNNGSNSYFPSPDTVTVGQTVAWHNADGTTHTATGNGGIPAFDTNNINSGSTSSPIQMNTTGSFPYHCKIHGLTMAGTLFVKP